MSFPIRRYPLDPTGQSPDNFVSGEEHVLGVKAGPYHPIAPFYGPFFNNPDTLKIYKGATLLVYEQDYWTSNLIQDQTAEFSGEVCELLIVKNMNEGDVITLNYQNLGGLFQNHAKGLVDLYNAYLVDNRPVDWVTGLRNKPSAYPPAYHLHMLSDVVGWEAVIVAIERLINVLSLRNVPAFEALIDWVMARTFEVVTENEISNVDPVAKVVTMERLIYAAKTLNFNAVTVKPRKADVRQGRFFIVDVASTNFPNPELLFWDIEHITTFPEMFKEESGRVGMTDQEGLIRFQSNLQENGVGAYQFRVRVRRNSVTGPILASSEVMSIVFTYIWELDYGLLANGLWQIPTTLQSHVVWQTPESLFLIPDDYFYKVSHV